MKTNSKLRTSLIIYAMILYGFLSKDDLEIFKLLITVSGIGPKGGLAILSTLPAVFWLLPAIVIHFRFSDNMFVKKEEMYLLRKNCWIFVPIMLLFTIYIFISEYVTNSKITISESFGINTVVEVLSIAIGEEMVFRGLFLNAILNDKKKYLAVFINSLMFLIIHFPAWIQGDIFISVFTSGGFICFR